MIVLDAVANLGNANDTSLTGQITVSGANRILFVSVANFTNDNITGVTFDGVAMTQIGASAKIPGNNYWVSLWYLIAPNTGTHDVVISASGTALMYAVAASYTGVAQTSPIDVSGNATASATSISKSLTTNINNDWAIAGVQSTAGTQTATSGALIRTSNANNFNLFDSNGAISPAGSTTIAIDFDTTRDGAMVMAAFKPVDGVSRSASLSPSSSSSPSRSPSASVSPSSSVSSSNSPSRSPSASNSPSSSISASISPSSSMSASFSPSASNSASPSPGYSAYSRGEYGVLPTNDGELDTLYTGEEEDAVSSQNNIIVGQTGVLAHMVHQFKGFIGASTFAEIVWEGKSTLPPNASSVYLQVYNQSTQAWETFSINNSHAADINFELIAKIVDAAHYKDGSNILSCRVYQLAI